MPEVPADRPDQQPLAAFASHVPLLQHIPPASPHWILEATLAIAIRTHRREGLARPDTIRAALQNTFTSSPSLAWAGKDLGHPFPGHAAERLADAYCNTVAPAMFPEHPPRPAASALLLQLFRAVLEQAIAQHPASSTK